MTQTLTLCDEYGMIYRAMQVLPNDELRIGSLEALAELEDNADYPFLRNLACKSSRVGVLAGGFEAGWAALGLRSPPL